MPLGGGNKLDWLFYIEVWCYRSDTTDSNLEWYCILGKQYVTPYMYVFCRCIKQTHIDKK